MVSKNNHKARSEKSANRFLRYGIKKFSVGAASVAIAAGLAFLGGEATDVYAQQSDGNEPDTSLTDTTGGDTNSSTNTQVNTTNVQGAPDEQPASTEITSGNVPANTWNDAVQGTTDPTVPANEPTVAPGVEEVQLNNRVNEDGSTNDLYRSVNGRVFVDNYGKVLDYTPQNGATTEEGKTIGYDEGLDSVPINFQWYNARTNQLSPVYKTTTDKDGRFELTPGIYRSVQADGEVIDNQFMEHEVGREAMPDNKLKVWIDEDWLKQNNYNYVGDASNGSFTGIARNVDALVTTFHQDTSSSKVKNFNLVVQPKDDRSQHKPEGERIQQVTPSAVDKGRPLFAVLNQNRNLVSGNVFWDVGYTANRVNYPVYKDTDGDVMGDGIDVLFSVRDKNTQEVKTYQTTTNQSGDFEFDVSDLAENGKFFGEDLEMSISVVVPDDVNVWTNSTLGGEFSDGTVNIDPPAVNDGIFREKSDGGEGSTIPIARFYSYNDGMTIKYNNGRNFQFVLRAGQPKLTIQEYNDYDSFAHRGDEVTAKTSGLLPKNTKYTIKWYEEGNDNPVKVEDAVIPNADGTLNDSVFTVPSDLEGNKLYRAELLNQAGQVLDIDTFFATTESFAKDPKYDKTNVVKGKKAISKSPKFVNIHGDEIKTTGESYELLRDTNTVVGASVNPTTGVVTIPGTATENSAIRDVLSVPVKVTYKDGTTDETTAEFVVVEPTQAKQADQYEPSYPATDVVPGDAVTVSPTFTKDGQPADLADVPLATDNAFVIDTPAGETAPEGVSVDPTTGDITITPEETAKNPGSTIEVPVKVTYEDGTSDKVTATVTVTSPDLIDRTGNDQAPTPEGYHRVTFGVDENSVNPIAAEDNKVYDVKEGSSLEESHYPTVTPKDGFEKPKWSIPAGTPITQTSEIVATATQADKAKDADQFEPAYPATDAVPGDEVTVSPSFTKDGQPADLADVPLATDNAFVIDTPQGETTPEGISIDPTTGEITITPEETAKKPGSTIEVPVKVTYEDGTSDKVTATVTVTSPDLIDRTGNDQAPTPEGYHRVTFKAGEGVNSIEEADNKVYDVKDGVALKEEDYPTVTAKDGYVNPVWSIPAGEPITVDNVGNGEIVATATQADKATDADQFEPAYPATDVVPGDAVTVSPTFTKDGQPADLADVPLASDNAFVIDTPAGETAPEGVSVDPTTGDITITPEETAKNPGSTIEVPVKVTYEDGTSDKVTATVTVTSPDLIDRTGNDQAPTPEGYHRVTFKAGEGVNSIEEADNKVYDVKDGVALKEEDYPTVTAKDGYVNPVWSIPAGTPITQTSEIVATATQADTAKDADKYEPTTKPIYANVGDPVDPADGIDNLGDLPTGTTVSWKGEAPSTEKPGVYTAPADVKYPDTSVDETELTVIVGDVVPAPDANGNQPGDAGYDPTNPIENPDPTNLAQVDLVAGDNGKVEGVTRYFIKKDVPVTKDSFPNTTITPDSGYVLDDFVNEAGEKLGTGQTFEPGSSTVLTAQFVPGQKDADKYEPKTKPIYANVGDPVDPADGIDNLGDLPTGTTVSWKGEAPSTEKPGVYTAPADVKYPDTSVDETELTVIVGDVVPAPDANGNQPGDAGYDPTNPIENPDPTNLAQVDLVAGDNGKVEGVTRYFIKKDVPVTKGSFPNTTITPDSGYVLDDFVNEAGEKLGEGTTFEPGSTTKLTAQFKETEETDLTVNPVTEGDTVVTGTTEPGASVEVKLPGAETPITTTADDQGNFSVEVPETVELKVDDVITVTATGTDKRPTTTEVTVGERDVTPAPVVTPITEGDTTITGTTEPGASVTVELPGQAPITTTADDKGNFSVEVPKDVTLKVGDEVLVTATEAGKKPGSTTAVVQAKPASGKPVEKADPAKPVTTPTETPAQETTALTVDPISEGDKVVTGTTEPGANVTVQFPGADPVQTVADVTGKFKVAVPAGVELKAGDQVTVTAVADGKKPATVTVTVQDTTSKADKQADPAKKEATGEILPETGEGYLLFGAAATSILAGLGLVAPRRKEED